MTYPVARYLSIDATESPSLSVTGDLLFLADTTGTPQAWRLSDPEVWPERLTAHDERISFVAASPTRREAIFGMDAGSDERDQLYLLDLADGTEAALTATPEAKHLWGGWSPDGDRFAFAANRREADTFDVYVQRRDKWAVSGRPTAQDASDDAADLVFEGTGGFLWVEAWGPEGDSLVLSEAGASYDQDLYLLDLETGERRRLTDDEPARYAHATFGPDGTLYAVTNRGADTATIARYDESEATFVPIREAGEWNVELFDLHPETGAVAYSRNVDGYSELYVGHLDADGDGVSLDAAPVPVDPKASAGSVVSDLTLGPDGERYALTLSRSDRPYSVYVGRAEDGEGTAPTPTSGSRNGTGRPAFEGADGDRPERWTAPGTLGIPSSSFRAPETVRYESFDGREIPAYWTLPPGADDADAGSVPVIVDIHGGPEHQRRPWFYPTKQYFLQRGYAVFEPNVRGSSGYGKAYTRLDDVERRMDSVKDVRAAVGWLCDREAVDPDRVVAYGRSYGGFMVLAALTEFPDVWAAGVEFVGIADFETFLENTGEWRRAHREAEYGSLADDRDLLRDISPLHRVDRISCPLFIQHGANDPRVPVSEAEQIADALRGRNVPVETLIFEDEGHHTTNRGNRIEEFERIAAFLDEHVEHE